LGGQRCLVLELDSQNQTEAKVQWLKIDFFLFYFNPFYSDILKITRTELYFQEVALLVALGSVLVAPHHVHGSVEKSRCGLFLKY
jgi:hypothetical protein